MSIPTSSARRAGPTRRARRYARALSMMEPDLIAALADNAGPTIAWLKTFGLRFDFLPTQFLTKSQPRLLPVGGGLALVEALAARAEQLGVRFAYGTAATRLDVDEDGAVTGLFARRRGRRDDPVRRAGRARLRRLRGQPRDAGALYRAARGLSPPDLQGRPLQPRRRHRHGARRLVRRRRAISAAIMPSRSIRAPAYPSRPCSCSPTAFWSTRREGASSTRRRARWMPGTSR